LGQKTYNKQGNCHSLRWLHFCMIMWMIFMASVSKEYQVTHLYTLLSVQDGRNMLNENYAFLDQQITIACLLEAFKFNELLVLPLSSNWQFPTRKFPFVVTLMKTKSEEKLLSITKMFFVSFMSGIIMPSKLIIG